MIDFKGTNSRIRPFSFEQSLILSYNLTRGFEYGEEEERKTAG